VLDFSYQHLNYRGVADLERALQTIALRLPRDVRLVVGVPRSGILPRACSRSNSTCR
jgi:hypothetical protein